ncbi:MAG: VanZ family protein [Vicinamibacterales bacterium]
MPASRSPGSLSLWLPVAVYMAAIFIASSASMPPGADLVPDKVVHAGIYGGLAVVVLRALGRGLRYPSSWSHTLWAVALTGLYGLSDEIHQSFVPLRQADPADLLADVLGATAAVLLTRAIVGARSARDASAAEQAARGRGV